MSFQLLRSVIIILGSVSLRDAAPHSQHRSLDLAPLLSPRLDKDREHHDPPPRGDPIGDPSGTAIKIEPQLAELAVKLLRMRFVK
jgi:hypothetical protein